MLDRNNPTLQQERFENYLIMSGFNADMTVILDFVVVEIAGEEISPNPGILYAKYDEEGDRQSHDPFDADVFIDGHIKWDGCSNWDFPSVKDCMIHFCGVNNASSIGRLMMRMYEIAATRIEKFDRELAGMD